MKARTLFLIFSSFVALVVLAAVIWTIENRHRPKMINDKYADTACVTKKLRPIHQPNDNILIFRNSKGGEFYTSNKELYDILKEGECVDYLYIEYVDESGVGRFNYEFRKSKGTTKTTDV